MAGIPSHMMRLNLPQRPMLVVELTDPIRGVLVARDMRVTAEGYRPPTVTPSNRFVWPDRDPPKARRIRLKAESTNGMFAPFEALVDVPANVVGVPASDITVAHVLEPTGLYEPPPGMIAVGGMLVEDAGAPKAVEGVRVRIHFHHAEGMETFTGPHEAVTDPKGRFMAVTGPLDIRPDPNPALPGTFKARLTLARGDEVRVKALSLRPGRLFRIPAPVEWAALQPLEEQ